MFRSKPFADFNEAASAVLALLHHRYGFGLWMVTRTEGDDWIVLGVEDHYYGRRAGDVMRWQDSICSRMVEGNGPQIAPSAMEVPAYADAPISKTIEIGAYVGMPLTRQDGRLFGTLCGIDPIPQPESLFQDLPLIETLARLLSTQLEVDLRAAEAAREAERARAESMNDALTGLYNRRGWLELSGAEESRCQRLATPACVLSIDLDDLKRVNDRDGHAAGDLLICRAAQAIRKGIRKHDIAARLGGDEFIILGVDCDRDAAMAMRNHVEEMLCEAGINASVGMAVRDPRYGLAHAVEEADQDMYRVKSMHREHTTRGYIK